MSDHWKSLANQLGAPGVDAPETEQVATPAPASKKKSDSDTASNAVSDTDQAASGAGKAALEDEEMADDQASHDAPADAAPLEPVAETPPEAAPAPGRARSTWETLSRMFNIPVDRSRNEPEPAPEPAVEAPVAKKPAAQPAAEQKKAKKKKPSIFDDAKPAKPESAALEEMFGDAPKDLGWKTKPRVIDDVSFDDDVVDEPSKAGRSHVDTPGDRDETEELAASLSFRKKPAVRDEPAPKREPQARSRDEGRDEPAEDEEPRRGRRRRRPRRGERSHADAAAPSIREPESRPADRDEGQDRDSSPTAWGGIDLGDDEPETASSTSVRDKEELKDSDGEVTRRSSRRRRGRGGRNRSRDEGADDRPSREDEVTATAKVVEPDTDDGDKPQVDDERAPRSRSSRGRRGGRGRGRDSARDNDSGRERDGSRGSDRSRDEEDADIDDSVELRVVDARDDEDSQSRPRGRGAPAGDADGDDAERPRRGRGGRRRGRRGRDSGREDAPRNDRDDDIGDDDEDSPPSFGDIPTWTDSLEGMISGNMDNHKKNESRGSRGRSRGRR